ncbi:MAG: hypothetical protein DMF87_06400 [Acidobacteria bacterium]|nr:MAG: hypothetical protein DMF87_06400 [Acidobacteriota bacterium]
MPVLNLSLVTQTFLTVINTSITNSPEWNAINVLDVSPLPPDRLAGNHTVGFYLYHLTEDASRKNPPPLAADLDAPDVFQPMGLQLYYLLTAHSDLGGPNGPTAEQLMMGLAIKALRDVCVIDDQTIVAGAAVLPGPLVGRGNRFRITLRAPSAEEAVQYWTAGSQPLRLAAYYEVSPVLLEPEPALVRPNRVFSFGVRSVAGGRPRLDFTTSDVTFQLPGEPQRTVEARPAEAPIGGRVTFRGSDLSGHAVDLLVRHVSWLHAEAVDPIVWGVTTTGATVIATVQNVAGTQVVLPGVYLGEIRITQTTTLPDGTTRLTTATSNAAPFAVTPRIDPPVNFVAGLGTITGTNFDPARLPDDHVQVLIGGERLTRVAAAPNTGQFRVVDASTIEFRLPATIAPGTIVSLRILVRGVESAPFWVTAP